MLKNLFDDFVPKDKTEWTITTAFILSLAFAYTAVKITL